MIVLKNSSSSKIFPVPQLFSVINSPQRLSSQALGKATQSPMIWGIRGKHDVLCEQHLWVTERPYTYMKILRGF